MRMLRDFGMNWVFSLDHCNLLSGWRLSAFNARGRKIWRMVPVALGRFGRNRKIVFSDVAELPF